MDRRSFISRTAAATALSTLARAANAQPAGKPDIVVIGAGVFGTCTALTLRERGHKVTLLDAYGPGNSRSASGDESRHIRAGYEERELYAAWSMKSMALWKEREKEFKRRFLYPAERLQLANTLDNGLGAQRAIFDKLRIPYDILTQSELQKLYPQIGFDDVALAFRETPASSAVLKARENVLFLAEALVNKGGAFKIAQAFPGAASGRTLDNLNLGKGETLSGALYIFATGPWLRKTFPALLGKKIASPRRELYYWGVPAGDTRFNWGAMPTWSDDVLGSYGFPNFDRGVKISPPRAGIFQQDPDDDQRAPSPYLMRHAEEYVATRFPGLKDMPIVESRICQVENTANGDFLVDRHPDYENVWIVGGGSGHGYKHGPYLGQYVADRVTGKLGDPELAKLFALAGRADV